MRTFRILILEDDLQALSVIMDRLSWLERIEGNTHSFDFAVTVMSEFTQVEQLVNPNPDLYDLILLDRDCRACGSFHVLDFNKFSPNKIISISTVPEFNEDAKKLGVKEMIRKDFFKLDEWGDGLSKIIKNKLDINR